MAVVYKAPDFYGYDQLTNDKFSIFLAGSIDMGSAVNWQERVEERFKGYDDIYLFNPRRDDWDSSWVQDINNLQFKEQVDWELEGIENTSRIIFNFEPSGPAPITLLELGYCLGLRPNYKPPGVYVCCPPGYWRKGNVDIICDRSGIVTYEDFSEMLDDVEMDYINGL